MEISHLLSLSHSELSGQDIVKIPTIIPNKVLMAPGTWNGVSYNAEEIKKAYENTDWSDKDVISIILDHSDKPLKVSDWIGWVLNPRMEGDNLIGDLELYDEPVLIKLVQAKAKFGISPRVKGIETDNKQFKNYTYENFSVVTNPAVKKAYINLSQERNKCKEVNMVNKEINSEDEVEDEAKDEEVEEESVSKKEPVSSKKETPVMSEEEILEVTTNSDWTDFVTKMRKQDPKMPLSEIAKAFKEKNKSDEALEQLSEEDLASRIKVLTIILAKKKKYPYPADGEGKDGMMKQQVKENKEILELSQKIVEMEKRLNEPSPKSVVSQELSDKTRMVSPHASGVQGYAEYLQNEFLK